MEHFDTLGLPVLYFLGKPNHWYKWEGVYMWFLYYIYITNE